MVVSVIRGFMYFAFVRVKIFFKSVNMVNFLL